MFGKRKIAAIVAEFLGTGILTLLVLSVQRSTIGVPFFVAMIAGLTVVLISFAVGNVSGAHVNPAITIALWTARKISTVTAIIYVAVQLLGAWAAYYLYVYFAHNHLAPIGGHFSGRILVAEAVGTFIFAFGFASAIYQGYNRATASAVVGISYMVGIVAASSASIGLANPALALGVRAWVWGTYVAGPVLGALLGVTLYGLLFARPEALTGGNLNTTVIETSVTEILPIEKVAVPKKTRTPRTTTKTKAKPATTRRASTQTAASRRATRTPR